MSVRCLVTGASGFLGRPLVAALAANDHSVEALCRSGIAPAGVDQVQRGDLCVTPSLVDCRGVVSVIHLAAIAHQRASADAYRRVNLDATLALARNAKAAGVKRFIFVSSVKALLDQSADSGRGTCVPLRPAVSLELREGSSSASRAVDNDEYSKGKQLDYAASKALAERGLNELCSDGVMELVIVRPALMYAAAAPGYLAWLRRWAKWRLPAPPPGGGRSMVARDDVVRLLLNLVDPQRPAGSTNITLTDGERYSVSRLHAALCDASGRKPLFPTPPLVLWRAAAALFDRLRGLPRGATWQRLVGEEYHRASGLEALAFQPALTFESSLGLETS